MSVFCWPIETARAIDRNSRDKQYRIFGRLCRGDVAQDHRRRTVWLHKQWIQRLRRGRRGPQVCQRIFTSLKKETRICRE